MSCQNWYNGLLPPNPPPLPLEPPYIYTTTGTGVTLDTPQIIAGTKTFTIPMTMSGTNDPTEDDQMITQALAVPNLSNSVAILQFPNQDNTTVTIPITTGLVKGTYFFSCLTNAVNQNYPTSLPLYTTSQIVVNTATDSFYYCVSEYDSSAGEAGYLSGFLTIGSLTDTVVLSIQYVFPEADPQATYYVQNIQIVQI